MGRYAGTEERLTTQCDPASFCTERRAAPSEEASE